MPILLDDRPPMCCQQQRFFRSLMQWLGLDDDCDCRGNCRCSCKDCICQTKE